MKRLLYFLFISSLLFSCNIPKSKKETEEAQMAWFDSITTYKTQIELEEEEIRKHTVNVPGVEIMEELCDIQYDTIKDENYKFHKWILDILNKKSSHSLDDQMVSRFMLSLNPREKEYYRKLTNKVIYALLEKQPAKLSNYNPQLLTKAQYDYFLIQISNPKCNSLPLGEILKKFSKEFPTGELNGPKKSKILNSILNAYYAQNEAKPKFNVAIVVKIPSDSLGATISITRDGKPYQTIKSDGLFYSIDFVLNSTYLISCSKKGYSTKIVTLDTTVPMGREKEEFAKFTMDIGLIKSSIDNKRDTSLPVGGVAYIYEEQDFNVVKKE